MTKSRSRDRSGTVLIASQLGIKPKDLKAGAQENQPDVKAKPPLAPTVIFAELPFVPPGNITGKLKSNGKLHDDQENRALMAQAVGTGNGLYQVPKSTKTNYQILVMDDPFINGKKVAYEIYSPPPQFAAGQGGFGYIRFGLNMETGEPVVLKFQDESHISNQEIIMLKKAERYLGDIAIEKRHMIAMDLARGKELSEWITIQSHFDQAQRYNMCAQAIREVIEVHRDRILHRDLKPKNMMYDAVNGELRVIDFGLAKKADEKASDLQAAGNPGAGTPGFRAPEILGKSQQVNYTTKSDVFALGLTLAEILGVYGADMEGLNTEHWLLRADDPTIPIKNDLEKVYPFLRRMINPDPKQRPTLNEALRFFEKMEALYDNEQTRTKQVGILDVGEYLKANDKQRDAMLQALSHCTEVWLTAGAKTNGKDYSKKDFLEVRAVLEQNHITVGNQIAVNSENQKLSAVELASQIPLALNRSPKFIYNYVYVCATSLTQDETAKLNAAQIGSLDKVGLDNRSALIQLEFQKQQELPAFQLKLHYMRAVTLLEHQISQFDAFLDEERNKPKPDAERIKGFTAVKNEAEIMLAALRTQYENNSLSVKAVNDHYKECQYFTRHELDVLEAKSVIENIIGKFEDEIRRVKQKHGTTDEKINQRIFKLDHALEQLKKLNLQPKDRTAQNINAIIASLKTELEKKEISATTFGFGIDTVKTFINKTLQDYLNQHKELLARLDAATLKDAKAAPTAAPARSKIG